MSTASVTRPGSGLRRTTYAYGDHALLVDLPEEESPAAFAMEIAKSGQDFVQRALAGESTVLVSVRTPADVHRVAALIQALPQQQVEQGHNCVLEVPVMYNGEDIDDVLQLTGLSKEGLVDWHSGQEWHVAFAGFSPGFAYLKAHNELLVPRRSSPRTSVPAGTVSIARSYSGIYPTAQPSGWQMIGWTNTPLWDSAKTPPTPLSAGTRVKFRAVREQLKASGHEAVPSTRHETLAPERALIATASHPGVTVQDRGRPGMAEYGVSTSGAFDTAAFADANRLVGNDAAEAALEITAGGFSCTARDEHVIAITGAQGSISIRTAGTTRTVPWGQAAALRHGEELLIGPPISGYRRYLAIRGGVRVPEELGSRSTDTLSGLGPKLIAVKQEIPIGVPPAGSVVSDIALAPARHELPLSLRLVKGPRVREVGAEALTDLLATTWTISETSNRVGVRLAGPPVRRKECPEMASEGMLPGSIQLPPSGVPLIFGADHPTTGGYPVIGVVIQADLPLLAQLGPGDEVTFTQNEQTYDSKDQS